MIFNSLAELKQTSFTRQSGSKTTEGRAFCKFLIDQTRPVEERYEAIIHYAACIYQPGSKELVALMTATHSTVVDMYTTLMRSHLHVDLSGS